jgi:hypothetical protein
MPTAVLAYELILHIIQFCDVPTLKCLCTVSRMMYDLIDTHQQYICSQILIHSLDAGETAAFRPVQNPWLRPLRSLFVTEHRIQTARWLSAVAFENHQGEATMSQVSANGNLEANLIRGDHIRDYLFVGWSILWRLSDIAYSVLGGELDCNNTNSHGVSSLTRGLATERIEPLEESIQHRQLDYVDTLSSHEAWCYTFMQRCVATVFWNRVFDDPRGKSSNWPVGNEYAAINTWLYWLILREGPAFITEAWRTEAGNEACSNYIIAEWSGRSTEQSYFERDMAIQVGNGLKFAAIPGEYEEPGKTPLSVVNNQICFMNLLAYANDKEQKFQRIYADVHYNLGRRLSRDVMRTSIEDHWVRMAELNIY